MNFCLEVYPFCPNSETNRILKSINPKIADLLLRLRIFFRILGCKDWMWDKFGGFVEPPSTILHFQIGLIMVVLISFLLRIGSLECLWSKCNSTRNPRAVSLCFQSCVVIRSKTFVKMAKVADPFGRY